MGKDDPEWEVYYHSFNNPETGKRAGGRGEYPRVLLEDAGIDYKDCEVEYGEMYCSISYKDGKPNGPYLRDVNEGDGLYANNPIFSPPYVVKRDRNGKVMFRIGQTGSIMEMMGKSIPGYYPETFGEQSVASALNASLVDFVADGRAPFHMTEPTGSYFNQKNNPAVIEAIRKAPLKSPDGDPKKDGRIYRWLGYFEHALEANEKRQHPLKCICFVGTNVYYVDLHAYQALSAARAQFDGCLVDFPRIQQFLATIEQRPNLRTFLMSDRRRDWAGDSMM